MALTNCIRCGKLIGETPSGYCDSCKTNDSSYSNLHKVKDFLYDNPNSTLLVVSEQTGVSVSEISRFIRSGAIVEVSLVAETSGEKCACGNPLEGNERTCRDCKNEKGKAVARAKKALARNVGPSVPQDSNRTAQGQFFLKTK